MTFLKNKKFAVIIMIVLIVFAVFFGAHRSLTALRRDAVTVYNEGDDTGLSIRDNMNSICEQASSLLVTAGSYYTDSDANYKAVNNAYKALRAATDPADQQKQLSSLLVALSDFEAGYATNPDVSAQDAKTMTRYINDIISYKDQIRHSNYAGLAVEFNRVLDGFPAGLLAGLTGVKALPIF